MQQLKAQQEKASAAPQQVADASQEASGDAFSRGQNAVATGAASKSRERPSNKDKQEQFVAVSQPNAPLDQSDKIDEVSFKDLVAESQQRNASPRGRQRLPSGQQLGEPNMTNHAQPRFEELKSSEQHALMQNYVAAG